MSKEKLNDKTLKKISDNEIKHKLLKDILEYFQSNLKLTPVIGVELEFYILKKNINKNYIDKLSKKIQHKILAEKGYNQYELSFKPSKYILDYITYINLTKSKLEKYIKFLGDNISFNSKPFNNDYGSAMHIHLNFLEDDNIEKYAKILCHYTKDYINYFLPKNEDYKRLDHQYMAPTHICYGNNNRTTMIRIPDSLPKRLEHRLAASDADLSMVIFAILDSIKKGIVNYENIKTIPKIFGNAFDKQYSLEKIY